MSRKRSHSEDFSFVTAKKQRTRTKAKIKTKVFLKTIQELRQRELEDSWEKEESMTFILLDTYSLQAQKKEIAACIAKLPSPGSVYVLRMHGGLLSFPFWLKMKPELPEEQKAKLVGNFFRDLGLNPGSPLYMTIHWLHAALKRNHALQRVAKFMVMTNSYDNPFPESGLRTQHGQELSYDFFTPEGRRISTALEDACKSVFNLKWIFVTMNRRAYNHFRIIKQEKRFFFVLIHDKRSNVLAFQLSKTFEEKRFQPALYVGQKVFLDRSDAELQRYKQVFSPFNEAGTRQFLRKYHHATMIQKTFCVKKQRDPTFGVYITLVRGCTFQTCAEGATVEYTVFNHAVLGLKDRVVTLKRNTQDTETNYLGRSLKAMYRVLEEDYFNDMVLVQDLDESRDNKFLVPRSKVILEDKCLII